MTPDPHTTSHRLALIHAIATIVTGLALGAAIAGATRVALCAIVATLFLQIASLERLRTLATIQRETRR